MRSTATTTGPDGPTGRQPPPWRNVRILGWAFQLTILTLVVAGLVVLVFNVRQNSRNLGIPTGFEFLDQPAGFPIPASNFRTTQPVREALVEGLVNTLRVSLVGIVAASALGLVVGVGRLSGNWLIATLTRVFVEVVRNIPLLGLLIFIYLALVLGALPPVDESLRLDGLLVANSRGVSIPWFNGQGLSLPRLTGRQVEGGVTLQPEYAALLVALTIYTASHIAEIVRGSIQAVPRGQVEAATAMGLSGRQRLRHVILPQALRIGLLPVGNQYLNLVKNSSLGFAVSFFELTKVTSTSIGNRTPAVPAYLLLMGTYLALSLTLAAVVNWCNRRLDVGRP
jgi:general L-amino acid transport system permease protein